MQAQDLTPQGQMCARQKVLEHVQVIWEDCKCPFEDDEESQQQCLIL
jgi:hypothetical protein